MKIFDSTEYIDPRTQKEPWYQLSVINQWDWSTKAICFEKIGPMLIGYCLKLNIPTNTEDIYSYKSEVIETITEEMKEDLLGKGMILSKNLR